MAWENPIGGDSDLADLMTGIDETLSSTDAFETFNKLVMDAGLFAQSSPSDWYKSFPYRFVIEATDSSEKKKFLGVVRYSLPIPPESFSVRPVFASDAVATMGGVIEERSDVVFYHIQMSGMFPHAMQRSTSDGLAGFAKPAKAFRKVLPSTGLASSLISGLVKPLESIGGRVSGTINGFKNGGIGGGLAAMFQPPIPYQNSGSAVLTENDDGKALSNGFTEAAYMQRFFLAYEKITARFSSGNNIDAQFKLYFENMKDNQKWRVIVKDLSISKNANSPYSYRYQIQLQGWDLSSPEQTDRVAIDRFGKDGDLATVNTLTLTAMVTGVKNAVGTVKKLGKGDLGGVLPPVI